MKQRWISALAIGMTLFLLFVLGLGMRRVVLEAQYRSLGPDFSFTLESAIHYRRVKMIHDTGTLPRVDTGIQYPGGVDVRGTYEFGAEYIQAALARALPAVISVGDRLRWVEAAWFCIGIPFMALWISWLTGNRWAGAVAGGFYAVMISSVIRSTGQELSKENFALPLLIGHLAFDVLARRRGSLPAAWISAALLGWSLWNWDLIQYYVLLWAAAGTWRAMRGTPTGSDPAWLPTIAAFVAVGVASPYYRAHAFLLSPALLLVYGQVAARLAGRAVSPWILLAPLGLAPVLAWISDYGASYTHFAGLLWAKIRFLNVKPADPALLSFDNRIMWVPALNSATIPLTGLLFPAILLTSFIAVLVAIRAQRRPETGQLIFYYIVSLFAFFFFVRFHVFLALFAAGWAGCLMAMAWESPRRIARVAAVVILATGFVVEAGNTAFRPERWGRGNVYYAELKELNTWLKKHAAPEAVLANFGTSGAIAAYGKCPVILHPKFESGEIRRRVFEYGELLFKGTETAFRDWADGLGAEYYVYAKGEFAEKAPELQMRYFVDALDPAERAPARLFEFQPDQLRLFRPMWSNSKYSVFKMRTRADEVAAGQHARLAKKSLEEGNLAQAGISAMEALRRNPDDAVALDVIRVASALQTEGFKQGANEHE